MDGGQPRFRRSSRPPRPCARASPAPRPRFSPMSSQPIEPTKMLPRDRFLGPSLRTSARHRPAWARPVLAHDPRRARGADGRLSGHRHIADARHLLRPGVGLCAEMARQRAPAAVRRHKVVSDGHAGALALATIVGPSLQTVVLVVILFSAPAYARIIRTQTLSLRGAEFVLAAVAHRRLDLASAGRACSAEHHRPDPNSRQHGPAGRHHDRGGHELPWPRCPPADAILGLHPQ